MRGNPTKYIDQFITTFSRNWFNQLHIITYTAEKTRSITSAFDDNKEPASCHFSYYAFKVPSDGNTLALMIAKCAIFMETGLAAIFRTVTVTEPSTVHRISDARLITERPL